MGNKRILSKWSKLSSESILKNAYFEIVNDKVKIPGVPIKDYIYMKTPDSAMMIAMSKDKKLPMIRQYRYLAHSEVIEFPAGGCEGSEDPEICARRECEEESGYECGKVIKLGQFYETYGTLNRQIHIYFSNDIKKTLQRPDNNIHHFEEIEVELIDYEEAIKMALSGKISGSPSMVGILLLKAKIDCGEINI